MYYNNRKETFDKLSFFIYDDDMPNGIKDLLLKSLVF